MGRRAISRIFLKTSEKPCTKKQPRSVHLLSALLNKEICQAKDRGKQGRRREVRSWHPARGGAVRADCGFSRPRGRPGGSARARVVSAAFGPGQSGGGREGARPAGAGPLVTRPEVRSRAGRARSAPRRASRLPAGHGAADFASRRRGGRGRVPGVPQVRRQLRGARAPRAGPAPLAGAALGRGRGRGARPPAPWNPFPGCWEGITLMSSFVLL